MSKYERQRDLFIDKVADLCRHYGFCLLPSDPYAGIVVVPFSDSGLEYLTENKTSDLPF